MKLATLVPLAAIAVVGIVLWQFYQQNQAFEQAESAQSTLAHVVEVDSGDTLTVTLDDTTEPKSVKLCGIRVAEGSRSIQEESRRHLQQLVDAAKGKVIVWDVNSANPNRLMAEVYVGAPTKEQPEMEKLLNGEQLAAGLASVSNDNCYNQSILEQIATKAKAQKQGLWAMTTTQVKQ